MPAIHAWRSPRTLLIEGSIVRWLFHASGNANIRPYSVTIIPVFISLLNGEDAHKAFYASAGGCHIKDGRGINRQNAGCEQPYLGLRFGHLNRCYLPDHKTFHLLYDPARV
jgi:hypothetical protein